MQTAPRPMAQGVGRIVFAGTVCLSEPTPPFMLRRPPPCIQEERGVWAGGQHLARVKFGGGWGGHHNAEQVRLRGVLCWR